MTTTRYWPDGKVWKVIDANGNNSVVNRYYGDGSLKEVEDAKGKVTTYGQRDGVRYLLQGLRGTRLISILGGIAQELESEHLCGERTRRPPDRYCVRGLYP